MEDSSDPSSIKLEDEYEDHDAVTENRPPHTATVVLPPQNNVGDSTLPLDWTQLGPSSSQNNQTQPKSVIRLPADVVDISSSDTELTIVGTAGQKITHMGRDFYKHCNAAEMTHLVLRSHVIRKMEGLRGFQKLELLELYDNQIEYLEDLYDDNNDLYVSQQDEENTESIVKEDLENPIDCKWPGKTIQILDMSYNVIRDMAPVRFCPNLVELCTF